MNPNRYDKNATLRAWMKDFSAAMAAKNIDGVLGLFDDTCFWRDFLAFTWTLRTLEGRDAIASMLSATLTTIQPTGWAVDPIVRDEAEEGWISFETALGRAQGYVRLRQGRCWVFLSALQELKGFEERQGRHRPLGTEPADRPRQNGPEAGTDELGLERQRRPYVLIVGGSQSGLMLGARLKLLGVPTLIVDRHARPGDQWRSRYASLKTHDPIWYDQMPYLPFPKFWPVFTPKDRLGDWLDFYAHSLELDYWGHTEWTGASYNAAKDEWLVEVERDGKPVILRPQHLVLATGISGLPAQPVLPGAERFRGSQRHSSQHPGGAAFANRKVVVIGSNNSAHDICADLLEHGADVTMIQRSPTCVLQQDAIVQALAPHYSEAALSAGITTEKADLAFSSLPLRMFPDVYRPLMEQIKTQSAAFYRGLEAAGFQCGWGEDGTGIPGLAMRRASGYYIDVGASALIASGRIGLRSGVTVERLEPDGLVLSDGSRLAADDIVYATGYESLKEVVARRISPQVAEKVGHVWGYGSGLDHDPGPWEGELRNMWKPTAQAGLWFHGGGFQTGRPFSLYLALQLKARMEKLPIRVLA